MTRGQVVAGVLVAAVAVGITLRLAVGGGSPDDATARRAAGALNDGDPSADRTDGAPGRASRSAAAIAARPFRGEDAAVAPGDATDSRTASSRPAGGRRLQVVFAPEDAPAPGATVRFMAVTAHELDDGVDAADAFASPEITGRHPPTTFVADAGGGVELPPFAGRAVVAATAADRTGDAILNAGDRDRFVVRLARTVAVLVVDAAGTPQAGVPVSLGQRTPWGPSEVNRAVTGRDGTARLGFLEHRSGDFDGGGSTPVAVGLALPLAEPVEVVLNGEAPPATPVRLVLPATGAVRVRLTGRDGTPFTGAARVGIRRSAGTALADLGLWRGDALRRGGVDARMATGLEGVVVAAVSGAAFFPQVGVGTRLVMHVQPADPALRAVDRTVDGPVRAGEEVAVDIACGAPATTITGRLVERDGRPVAQVVVSAQIAQQDETARAAWEASGQWANARTGTDGRFALHFALNPTTLTATSITFDLRLVRWSPRGTPLPALALPSSVATGTGDVGDVVLADRHVLVAGVVVDGDGVPLAGAMPRIRVLTDAGWDESGDLDYRPADAGADGQFEVEGVSEAADLGVTALLSGWMTANPVAFTPGARDARVVMTRAGGIEGSFAGIGVGDAPCDVFLVGEPARSEALPWDAATGRAPLMVDGRRFGTRALRPGMCALHLCIAGRAEPVLTVDNLAIKAGEINRDPRIQNIDIHKLVDTRTITVNDDTGQPLAGARVGTKPTGQPKEDWTAFDTDERGRALIAPAPPSMDAVVSAKGWQSVSLSAVTANATVQLRRAKSLTLLAKLDPGTALPEAPLTIVVRAYWVGPVGTEAAAATPEIDYFDPRNLWMERGRFGADRTVALALQEPGVYRMGLWLCSQGARGTRMGVLAVAGPPAVVTVSDSGTATITIAPTPQSLAVTVAAFTDK